MLPLLPVLLLLFFQGPANIERLALEGRLPQAIEAIQHLDGRGELETEALAKLLAAGKDPQLARALITILSWTEPEPVIETSESVEDESIVPILPGDDPPPHEGFSECRRSRDGPWHC